MRFRRWLVVVTDQNGAVLMTWRYFRQSSAEVQTLLFNAHHVMLEAKVVQK